ncbi:MAG: alkaline phosphatase PhoX [Pyrinomonadaceae bacterium]
MINFNDLAVEGKHLSKLGRREFLLSAGLTGGGLLAFYGLAKRYGLLEVPASLSSTSPYGPLSAAKTNNTGETLLALPRDFQYNVFGKTGTAMFDQHPTPSAHDGMAAFVVNNQLRLVRNHEVDVKLGKPGAAIGPNAYDQLASGGTTTLIIDPKTRELVRDFVSLSGTVVNCAGGATPWNSWISCEETVLGPAPVKNTDGVNEGEFEKHHGYCFEVSASANEPVAPVPLKAMGRFVHEAVAFDTQTGIVYLTEDFAKSGFYRFIPDKAGELSAGGRLQMLAIKDRPNFDTRTGQKTGIALPAAWVDISNPDPPEAELDNLAVYKQGIAAGAATFARLEGCFYGNGVVYFTSTSGGNKELGQVWQYVPAGKDEGHLTLLLEPGETSLLYLPDNICLAGRNLVICEDNDHWTYLRVLTPKGQVFDLAKNIAQGFEKKELAGLTFSPDGQTLFVNLQVPGMTFAIWGPWERVQA